MTIISIDRREREASPQKREIRTAAADVVPVPENVKTAKVVRCSAWAEPVSVNWDLDPMAA